MERISSSPGGGRGGSGDGGGGSGGGGRGGGGRGGVFYASSNEGSATSPLKFAGKKPSTPDDVFLTTTTMTTTTMTTTMTMSTDRDVVATKSAIEEQPGLTYRGGKKRRKICFGIGILEFRHLINS